MNIDQIEEQDGVRLTWNVWPSTKGEAQKYLDIPLGLVYQPLHGHISTNNQLELNQSYRIQCQCGCYINSWCSRDTSIWVCPICNSRYPLPPDSRTYSSTTIEYVSLPQTPQDTSLLFVIDTTAPQNEIDALKTTITLALASVPSNVFVGLIVYGKHISVYDMSSQQCPRAYVLSGSKSYTAVQLTSILSTKVINQLLAPLSECELTFMSILDDLTHDEWPVSEGHRPLRCNGSVISVASSLLESRNVCGTIEFFITGPCTFGPGMIVSDDLKEQMRTHADISQERVKYLVSAETYYKEIASRLNEKSISCNIFSCSMDQIGILEMSSLCQMTNGYITMYESYMHETLSETLQRMLQGEDTLNNKYCYSIEVYCSKEIKPRSCIGHVTTSENKEGYSSLLSLPEEFGVPGNKFKTSTVDPHSSFVFLFDIVNPDTNPLDSNRQGIIQLVSKYMDTLGRRYIRVTTICRLFTSISSEGLNRMSAGFDQETAAVVMARCASFKADAETGRDAMRWLDRALLRTCNKFGEFRKDDPSSFNLNSNFSILPQFMYHLRRSHFLQVFNCSPDETRTFRTALMRENVNNSLIMIQPTLDCYKVGQEAKPVLLSMQSVESDSILLLDTFFYIVVFRGEAVADWMKQKLEEQPEYAGLKEFYQKPEEDAREMAKERIPSPRIYVCNRYSGHQRFLMTILDPAVTPGQNQKDIIVTEDVTLKVFMEHLRRLSVKGNI
ncbi:Sec23 protein, putative [Entamoeba histolytica HM-1:IMSS-B]|uniref:Protein transport protein SEC23 n=7 Tax=Entamoeba histolytica TaxID=5759 RepID=A0A8U0WPJ2_ENTH1|nr:Sec23 protein, putative [Entamoeba histolytica HM-1:IMSS]EMD48210.1 protein transport protein SEC23, putative [Entamoeba histolytica KU27]EMH73437.1 Sec23 protein, putative [Entamoeba histolytica HM-1:IMSS-B]EMS15544.1 protein transport protein SEC23, putative [Entamoeba histolytica HM-3:IMSS]ENY63880.1 protein transport protein SEC23, putative [Entamoeba histolytica HM-1:IMSS-A]BAE94760.1 EhSec23B [Entamoeba histolytica]|eukprot:XP_649343.1 Sec23 protein, putative [Entamoeba histolytica HM-1:IMSS]